MKLINHQKNNFYTIDSYVMRGTIKMTAKEWQIAYLWLWGQYKKAVKNIDTYKRDSLSSLNKEKGRLFCLGVCATGLIANKHHLNNYKDQNYGIRII